MDNYNNLILEDYISQTNNHIFRGSYSGKEDYINLRGCGKQKDNYCL